MSYGPNVDGAVRLARRILPLVQPAARLPACPSSGATRTPAVIALGELPGVTVTGIGPRCPADTSPRPPCSWLPLRFGAGIQNKLLEAMAMAVPSVVTDLAADGLRTTDGTTPPVLVAEGDDTLAAAIGDVLERTAGIRARTPTRARTWNGTSPGRPVDGPSPSSSSRPWPSAPAVPR